MCATVTLRAPHATCHIKVAAMLYSLLGVVLASRAEEEAAMMRMLTLKQRSLVSDRPLPVVPLPGAASATGSPPQQLNGSCAAADLGYPTSISTWAARFAWEGARRQKVACRAGVASSP